jgi:hypothetical protein
MTESFNPQLEAMQRAMKAAEVAAEQRRLAKLAAEGDGGRFDVTDAPDDDMAVILATAVGSLPDEAEAEHYHLGDEGDLGALIAALDAQIPEMGDREEHGDLVVFKPQDQAKAWYELAAEAALPESLREVKGAIDVKLLLQALLVEIGDVKRTNAILMEHMTRLEEKVDRTNRHLRERKGL